MAWLYCDLVEPPHGWLPPEHSCPASRTPAPTLPRKTTSSPACCTGSTTTVAMICSGSTRAAPIGSGCRKSCCSDPGGHGHPVLPAVPAALPDPADLAAASNDAVMAQWPARLLRPRTKPACRGKALRGTARRRPAARFRCTACPARHRPQHRWRDPQPSLERPARDSRRQRQARTQPLSRHRRLPGLPAIENNCGRLPTRTSRRCRPGAWPITPRRRWTWARRYAAGPSRPA